jgi:two-component system NarL family sensor kinase
MSASKASPGESLDWLRKLARISPIAIFRMNAQGACTYVNERWCELTGRSAEEALGSGWELAIHPDDLETIREKWRRRNELPQPFRGDYRYLRPDGQVVWMHSEVAAEYDEAGRIAGWIGCVTDISELQQAREDLQRMHDALEAHVDERTQRWREMVLIVEEMDDAVIWSDLAGRIVGWNRAAEKLLGYKRSEVIGGSTLAITPAEDQGTAIEIKRRVRLGESVHHREVVRVAKGGRRIPVLLSVFPLRNDAGSIMGSAAILRDLTSQKRAESGMRRLSQRLLGAQDEERRRIARELHDSTAQLLVALSISLNRLCMEDSTLSTEARAELLAESCLLSDRATKEVRTQSYLLHPPLLEERGLAVALRFFIDGFTERSGITVQFHAPRNVARLEPLVELTVFRIVQEALANVHRHSESERAEVTLSSEPGWIELIVRDFGCGLPASPGELRGVGIAGMQERVAQLGGSFALETNQPGVKLRVTLPLTPPT